MSVQGIDEKDGKLAYIVYRLGKLPEQWSPVEGLSPKEFVGTLDQFALEHYSFAWSVRKNDEPVCIVFGVDAGFVVIGDVIWNPKASNRQKLEAGAKYFSELKDGIVFSEFDSKKYYERLMDYGILRRVGTVYRDGTRMAQFQTRV